MASLNDPTWVRDFTEIHGREPNKLDEKISQIGAGWAEKLGRALTHDDWSRMNFENNINNWGPEFSPLNKSEISQIPKGILEAQGGGDSPWTQFDAWDRQRVSAQRPEQEALNWSMRLLGLAGSPYKYNAIRGELFPPEAPPAPPMPQAPPAPAYSAPYTAPRGPYGSAPTPSPWTPEALPDALAAGTAYGGAPAGQYEPENGPYTPPTPSGLGITQGMSTGMIPPTEGWKQPNYPSTEGFAPTRPTSPSTGGPRYVTGQGWLDALTEKTKTPSAITGTSSKAPLDEGGTVNIPDEIASKNELLAWGAMNGVTIYWDAKGKVHFTQKAPTSTPGATYFPGR